MKTKWGTYVNAEGTTEGMTNKTTTETREASLEREISIKLVDVAIAAKHQDTVPIPRILGEIVQLIQSEKKDLLEKVKSQELDFRSAQAVNASDDWNNAMRQAAAKMKALVKEELAEMSKEGKGDTPTQFCSTHGFSLPCPAEMKGEK